MTKNVKAFIISSVGGALSLYISGYIGIFGFALIGVAIGISIGVMTNSVKKAVFASAAGGVLAIFSLVVVLFLRFVFSADIFAGIVLGGLMGGGLGVIAGYEGEHFVKDSIETVVAGIVGGGVCYAILSAAYSVRESNSVLLPIAGAVAGAVLGGAIIFGLELAKNKNNNNKLQGE